MTTVMSHPDEADRLLGRTIHRLASRRRYWSLPIALKRRVLRRLVEVEHWRNKPGISDERYYRLLWASVALTEYVMGSELDPVWINHPQPYAQLANADVERVR